MHHGQITHQALTINQFTRQAVPFASLPGHSSSLDILSRPGDPNSADLALDVACGPGLVACHFAPFVSHITGIDITPEMIRQATRAQPNGGLKNMTWQVGFADPLPFEDATFSLVLTRYSFYHFQRPGFVLAEMTGVCRPGGRVLVADVAQPADKVAGYDEIQLLRDPSHTHALSRDEFASRFGGSGQESILFDDYKVKMALETQRSASFPVPGGAERIRELVRADVGHDRCGLSAHWVGSELHCAIPEVVAVGRKPASQPAAVNGAEAPPLNRSVLCPNKCRFNWIRQTF
jgi:SAM-dependent methyltransferase